MSAALLLLSWLAPLLLAAAAHRRGTHWLPALAAGPALAAVLLVPADRVLELPWLLLGTRLGLDDTGRVFLLGSALLWFSAALYAGDSLRAAPRAGRFRVFFLLAMAGNFQLTLAQDAVSFYLGFALMGLAAYGLVAQRASLSARRAARAYLAWTIAGEVLLFAGLVLLAAGASGLGFAQLRAAEPGDAAVLLLLLGFGIKVALPGLHGWLPLAYPAAPAAGAAVLSGAMINAGLLGWLRFLPLGETGHGDWGMLLVGLGLLGAFYGVAIGLLQRRPKVVLAYSSISQLGLLSAAIGLILAAPAQAPLLLGAVILYALHHGLAKGALFLALDAHARRRRRGWSFALLVLLALTLAGLPLTSGALAKGAYKAALPPDWGWLPGLLVLSTLATTLLMARFLVLARRQRECGTPLATTGTAAALLPLLAGLALPWTPLAGGSSAALAIASAWPVAAGAALAAALWRRPWAPLRRLVGGVPAGDLPTLCARRLVRWRARTGLPAVPLPAWPRQAPPSLAGLEAGLRRWPVAGTLWLALLLGLAVLLLPALTGPP